ncbi:MAG TPA: DNA-protecting protein DprA [Kofleriaceae bacterium]|nr:DNA-protecting protein DprA [Kofleriaceae bacterium]
MTSESQVLRPGDAGYPRRLLALGCTQELHVRGNLAVVTDAAPAIAIVGARAASGPSMQRAHAIARHLAERGAHVVSGGALGIDGAAHRGVLAGEGAGQTIVVLGSGVDVAYPSRHAQLFEDVVARGGLLVSMFALGMQPRRGTFLQRNELIAALADTVIVIEAQVKSGSLSTAAHARNLGRPIGATPESAGCKRLIAAGAALVENAGDVMRIIEGNPRVPAPVVLDEDAQRVRDALAQGATGIDAIVRVTGLPVRAVLRALPQLESSARMQ